RLALDMKEYLEFVADLQIVNIQAAPQSLDDGVAGLGLLRLTKLIEVHDRSVGGALKGPCRLTGSQRGAQQERQRRTRSRLADRKSTRAGSVDEPHAAPACPPHASSLSPAC